MPTLIDLSLDDVLARAASSLGRKVPIRYKLGTGGRDPDLDSPEGPDGCCDCSGFVCWALGISRRTDHPWYRRFNGGWINTDSIVADAKADVGFFARLTRPQVGSLVVFDAGKKIGHVGIVAAVKPTAATRNKPPQLREVLDNVLVIHCSSGNQRSAGKAIQKTNGRVFARPDTIFAWYAGLGDHGQGGEEG